ncbi:MAG: zf-TFIIB domain-containing protein, partial [Gemmatimonadaceae bacterium]|nr:zf-TFIIB domain-containing protein [Gemmatimonadaceae bacterium]
MSCPNCDRPTLRRTEVEPALQALRCGTCNGEWIRLADYEAWRSASPEEVTPV